MEDVRCRPAGDDDFPFLAAMLGEAAVWLSIAVIASRRHERIGRLLLVGLIEASVAQGHAALNLSVSTANPARGLYESVGFQIVETRESGLTMVRHTGQDVG